MAHTDPGVRLGLCIIFAGFEGYEYDYNDHTYKVRKSSG
jgi:hypothetical protein